MKKLLLLLFAFTYAVSIPAQDTVNSDVSTYFLIRHAEKVVSRDTDPALDQWGVIRASQWAAIFSDIPFDAIYSTDYIRTINTVKPTADILGLEITLYDPGDINYIEFLEQTRGKTVLIVGHSNTIPGFVNSLTGREKYEQIEDNNNGNLYIVEISGNHISDILLHIN
ncbi:MAG TPA: phosphoglycerate mutase family protein [Bacteroidales bacterium]|nr:phosphoglycerate mutase family protein [Bacteroidales bacterium]